jgi:MFS transporter, DHA1 family, inner membrane transport protein
MMGGLTVAMVIGVPLGSWIAPVIQLANSLSHYNWHGNGRGAWSCLVSAARSLLSAACILCRATESTSESTPLVHVPVKGYRIRQHFRSFHVSVALLTDITGASKEAVNIAVLLFGGATVMGNLAGGILSDAIGTRKAR